MKKLANLVVWTFVLLVCVYAAIRPETGVLYHNPLATVGVGLIGLGLFLEARRDQTGSAGARRERPARRPDHT